MICCKIVQSNRAWSRHNKISSKWWKWFGWKSLFETFPYSCPVEHMALTGTLTQITALSAKSCMRDVMMISLTSKEDKSVTNYLLEEHFVWIRLQLGYSGVQRYSSRNIFGVQTSLWLVWSWLKKASFFGTLLWYSYSLLALITASCIFRNEGTRKVNSWIF